MSTVQGRLRIAVQKSGRLADRSLDLIRDAGLKWVKGHNDLLYRVENYPIDLLRVRDDDIPTFVADGVCDLGVVGENVLEEARNGGAGLAVAVLSGNAAHADIAHLADHTLDTIAALPALLRSL